MSALSNNDKTQCVCQANPTTRRGRRAQLVQLLMLPMVNIAVVIIYTMVLIVHEADETHARLDWTSRVHDSLDATYALRALERERQVVALWSTPNMTSALYQSLEGRQLVYRLTDESLGNVTRWPGNDRCTMFFDLLPDHRLSIESDGDAETEFYNELIRCVLDAMYGYVGLQELEHDLAQYACTFNALLELKEAVEQLRLIGLRYFSVGFLSPAQHVSYIEYSAVVKTRLAESVDQATELGDMYSWRLQVNDSSLLLRNAAIRDNVTTTPDITRAIDWDVLCDNYSAILNELTDDVGDIITTHSRESHTATFALTIVLYAAIIVTQVPIVAFLVNNAVITMESIRNMVLIFASRTNDLKKEKRRAEVILSGMLPKAVAKDLRLGRAVHAQQYASATVFFRCVVVYC